MPESEELDLDSQDSGYGQFYLRWCKRIINRFPMSPEKLKKTQLRRKEGLKKEEKRYQKALFKYKEIQKNHDELHKIYRKAENKLKLAERALERAQKKFKQEKFNKAVALLGMDISLQEVMTFSGFCALVTFLFGFFILVFTLLIFNTGIIEVAMFLVPAILGAPLLVFAFAASYPEILANRVKTKSLGRSPEAVNYLVMSMRLSPSLSKAVAFAADSADEPIASGLKKVLWNIYMRKHDNVEESFLAFAYEWGEINEDFKRSLYAIRSSTLERSDEGRTRILEKAQEIVLEGTKRKIEDFASSLHAPTTVLFALGILLPMIIGAMLPMMSLSVPSGASFGAATNPNPDNSQDIAGAVTIVLLMDIVFPLVAFFYAYHILGKRPGTATPPDVKSEVSVSQKRVLVSISAALILGFGVLGTPYLRRYLGDLGTLLGPVWVLLGIGFALGFYFRSTSKSQKRKRDDIKKMEEEFPDALFKLGSRIAEGEPLETALGKVADSMKGSLCADLFEKIAYTIQVTRLTPEDAMFAEDLGVLNDLPSRTIRASMRTVIESTKKDAQNAGSIIINISNYLRDMKKVEHDIRTSLNQTVSMMKSTGLLFAPLIMGITASLYVLLSREFANLPGSTQMLSNDLFFMVIGVYLIMMVIVTVYFSVGIEHGEDSIELKYSLGNAVPLAIIVYAFSLVAGQFLIS